MAAAALLCLLILLSCASARGQQICPLQGQRTPPDNGTTVYVSVVVDRLLNIDDSLYRFEAVLYVYLSWTDDRAAEAISNSTATAAASGGCNKPCTMALAWSPGDPCCNELFLPSFSITNVHGFSQDNIVSYGIHLFNTSVVWTTRLQGVYYTPLSFSAFPFDTQYLVVQVEQRNQDALQLVRVKSSLSYTHLYQPQSGDMVSGWTLVDCSVMPYVANVLSVLRKSGVTSAPGEPLPLISPTPGAFDFSNTTTNPGFNIVLTVRRASFFYVITAIVPIALNVYLALLVFAVHPKNLDTRLGVVVTLFLALTAILFVVAGYLPASSRAVPTQQLVIVSYFVLAIIGISSIFTYEMVSFQSNRLARKRAEQASRRFDQRWVFMSEEKRTGTVPVPTSALSEDGLRQRSKLQAIRGGEAADGAGTGRASGCSVEAGAVQQHINISSGVSMQAVEEEPWACTTPPSAPLSSTAAAHGGSAGLEGSGSSGSSSQHGSERELGAVRLGVMPHPGGTDEEAVEPRRLTPAQTLGTTRGWWLLRWASCCLHRGRRPAAGVQRLNWFQLQQLRVAEMAAEMERDKDYALHLALKVDKWMLWLILVGYTIAIVLIFALGAQNQTQLTFG